MGTKDDTTPAAAIDPHVLAMLDPWERDVAMGKSDAGEADEDVDAAGADDDGDDDDDDDTPAAAPAAAPAPAPAAAPASAAAPAPAPAAAEAADEDEDPAPRGYVAPLPEDFETKLEQASGKQAELRAQFKSCELDFDAYTAAADEARAELEQLNSIKMRHDIAADMQRQAAEAEYRSAVLKIAKLGTAEGVDYRKSEELRADFDAFMDRVAKANPNKPIDWLCGEAHRRVKALHGIAAAPTPSPAPAAPVKKTKADINAERKPPIDAVPQGLANVPGGEGPGDLGGEGEFAHLDQLNGLAFEDAIRKMTPDQRERYARMQ